MTTHFFPAHVILNRDWSQAKRKILEMKGKTYVRGEKQSMTLQAESIEDTWIKVYDEKENDGYQINDSQDLE